MKSFLRGSAFALPLSIAALTFGCGSSTSSSSPDTDGGAKGDASTKGDTGGGASTPTFTDVYPNVLMTNTCTLHHSGASPSGDPDMSTPTKALHTLGGVAPAGPSCAGMGKRVVAGSASTSLLYEKVSESTPPCGAEMPMGGDPISTADMTTIKDWINGGAKND